MTLASIPKSLFMAGQISGVNPWPQVNTIQLKKKKPFLLIWILICVLAMIYQSFETTVIYFNYEVTSTTVIKFETRFMMPAGSACFEVNQVRIPSMFPEGHPCRGPMDQRNSSTMTRDDPRHQECQEILLSQNSYTKVHNNLTWDFLHTFKAISKYMDQIWWYTEDYSFKSPERFKSYYKPPRKCIKMSWDEKVPFEMLKSYRIF